jgi:hypothetical protein
MCFGKEKAEFSFADVVIIELQITEDSIIAQTKKERKSENRKV